jgi:ATP-GRASP peptide maturase of grasp-with-spasm system
MILIVSQDRFEASTQDVIDWISLLKGKFYRLNGDEFYSIKGVKASKIGKDGNINDNLPSYLKEVNIAWFRRWNTRDYLDVFYNTNRPTDHSFDIYNSLHQDSGTIRQYFFYNLQNLNIKKWLTPPSKTGNNKLITLSMAKEVGLTIPETAVIGTKTDLIEFYKLRKTIITKDLTAPFVLKIGDEGWFMSKTREVSKKFIDTLPDTFIPSLFQELVEKSYELRIFYLDGIFYSMAIFSQKNKKTQLDFRNYDTVKPNRTVPYKLPKSLEAKLSKLLEKMGLNTASIDIIRKKGTNEYIFLEVNPVGQFGMTSIPCNYYLEKKIAEYLIQNDRP